jgi:hypothetical protein
VTRKEKIEYFEIALVRADESEIEVQLDPRGKFLHENKKD